jgi:uncharacterized protein
MCADRRQLANPGPSTAGDSRVTHFAFPFQIDATGRVAVVDRADHVRQLVEQLLFTVPGERVNRPTFGSAADNLVFAAETAELATTIQLLIQSALQRWLGDELYVETVHVTAEDTRLRVTAQYVLRATQRRQVVELERGLPA